MTLEDEIAKLKNLLKRILITYDMPWWDPNKVREEEIRQALGMEEEP